MLRLPIVRKDITPRREMIVVLISSTHTLPSLPGTWWHLGMCETVRGLARRVCERGHT